MNSNTKAKKIDLFTWISTIILFDFVIAGYLLKIHFGFLTVLSISGMIAFFWPALLFVKIFFKNGNQFIERMIILPVILIFFGFLFGKSESLGNLFNFDHALLFLLMLSSAILIFDLFFGAKIRKRLIFDDSIFTKIDTQKSLALFGLGVLVIFISNTMVGNFGHIDKDIQSYSTQAINLEKFSESKPNQMIIARSQTKITLSSNVILMHSISGISLSMIFKLGEVLLAAYIFPVYAIFKYFYREKVALVFIASLASLSIPLIAQNKFHFSIDGLTLVFTFSLLYFLIRMIFAKKITFLFFLAMVILTIFTVHSINSLPLLFWILVIIAFVVKIVSFRKIIAKFNPVNILKI